MNTRDNFAAGLTAGDTRHPLVMGRHGVISSGHFLATAAGYHILSSGGSAIDAGIAAGVALNVLLFDRTSFGGVAPIILHEGPSRTTVTIDGLGVWPRMATLDYMRSRCGDFIPEGILRSVVPGAPDAWMTALSRFGTLTLCEVLEPAMELALKGAPVSVQVASALKAYEPKLDKMDPEARRIFFPNGLAPSPGDVIVQEDLGLTLKRLMDEEAKARRQGLSREDAIQRARDLFYKGSIAEEVGAFHEENGGLIRYEDLASYRAEISLPLSSTYKGYEVYTCGPWCQGPLLLEFLNILENFDLTRLEHNGTEYLHLLLEAMDLGFADRENYYSDPRHTPVPLKGLISKEYAKEQAKRVRLDRASGKMPEPGNPWRYQPGAMPEEVHPVPVDVSRYIQRDGPRTTDTTYVAVADENLNVFSAKPSDSIFHGPIIPGLGFSCSGRGSQSRLLAGHPAALAPGRRPRLTPNPALVMLDGRPLLGFGCPGGDAQTQGMLQVFLNIVDFGMNLQEAVESPRVVSKNFPDSFSPFTYNPGRVDAESRIHDRALRELQDMGHDVRKLPDWAPQVSSVHVVLINPRNGVLMGAADPRREGMALAW
jgi:gamma-glutamyltranspeptidase/glutathione hydrolase